MKRASVSFDQFHVDDEGNSKSKYQTLLKEYLELQKEFVSRKRKLQAAKKKRENILSEVKFLRRRHKLLSKIQAPNIGRNQFNLSNNDIETKTLEGERYGIPSEVAPGNFDEVMVTNSHMQKEEEGEGIRQVLEEERKFAKNPKNYLIHDKRLGKRKISWPDQVTLKV